MRGLEPPRGCPHWHLKQRKKNEGIATFARFLLNETGYGIGFRLLQTLAR